MWIGRKTSQNEDLGIENLSLRIRRWVANPKALEGMTWSARHTTELRALPTKILDVWQILNFRPGQTNAMKEIRSSKYRFLPNP